MLDKSKYRVIKGFKYLLTEQVSIPTGICPPQPCYGKFICLLANGVMELKVGFAWDGPSGPTIDTEDFMRGAMVHDGFYRLIRKGKLPKRFRKKADKLLRKMCRADGMPWWRAWYVYRMVRRFGWLSTRPMQAV